MFGIISALILTSMAVMSIETTLKAYGQNASTTETAAGQMTNMTNTTGVSSGAGEYDERGEAEEGPGEDQDEPGDIDTGDKED